MLINKQYTDNEIIYKNSDLTQNICKMSKAF